MKARHWCAAVSLALSLCSLAACGKSRPNALDPAYLAKIMTWADKTCACKTAPPTEAKACLAAAAFDRHKTPTGQVYGDYRDSLPKGDQDQLNDLDSRQSACEAEVLSKAP